MQKAKEYQTTIYRSDGTICSINEFNPSTGKKVKTINYRSDGQTIDYIEEFNPQTGKIIKDIFYNPDGSISSIEEYDEDDDDHECNCEYCDQ
ncbi:hypothetical Protein pso3_03340 [Candidatus Phytoplasma solani]